MKRKKLNEYLPPHNLNLMAFALQAHFIILSLLKTSINTNIYKTKMLLLLPSLHFNRRVTPQETRVQPGFFYTPEEKNAIAYCIN